MKSLPAKRGIILAIIGLFICGYAEVWGANWEYCGHTSDEVYFYDRDSMSYPTKDLTRVWIKIVKGGEEYQKKMDLFIKLQDDSRKMLKEKKEGYTTTETEVDKTSDRMLALIKEIDAITNGAHEKHLLEIKCEQKMSRLINMISYDKDLAIIKRLSDDNAKWLHIVPESIMDGIFKEVCRSAK